MIEIILGVLICILILILIYYLVMTEIDRHFSFKYPINDYYSSQMGFGALGFLNTHIRAISWFDKKQRGKHILPLEYFPERDELIKYFDVMREEILNVYNTMELKSFHEVHPVFNRISSDKWKTVVLKWYDKSIDSNCVLCPKTCEIVNRFPNIKSAMFSIMLGGNFVPEHRGPFSAIFRVHLGILIPEGECYIEINGEKYYWKEGEFILFDDTYKHHVYNNTSQPRIVLFMDVVRSLPPPFYYLNKKLCQIGPLLNFTNQVNSRAEITQKISDI